MLKQKDPIFKFSTKEFYLKALIKNYPKLSLFSRQPNISRKVQENLEKIVPDNFSTFFINYMRLCSSRKSIEIICP